MLDQNLRHLQLTCTKHLPSPKQTYSIIDLPYCLSRVLQQHLDTSKHHSTRGPYNSYPIVSLKTHA